jgi:phosphate:Na+ symporter
VLAVTLNLAGALPLPEALLLVSGANVGSGMSISLVTSHLRGPPRLLAVWQCVVRIFGTLILLPLVFLIPEDAAERAAAINIGVPTFIAFFFLSLQVVGALVSGLLQSSLLPVLTRFIPEEEAQARFAPRHIYAEAARCPDTALLLAHREQDRLLRELPSALDPLRAAEVSGREILSNRERREAANALCRQIADYLADVAAQDDAALPVATLFAARARNEAISALQESLHALVDTLEGLPAEGLAVSMTESLHLVLELLTESLVDGIDNADILETLTSDRSELMEGIRRSLLSEAGEASTQRQALFVATSLFERALWLGRQMLGVNQVRTA